MSKWMVWEERADPRKRDSTRWGWGVYDGPHWIKQAGGWVATCDDAHAAVTTALQGTEAQEG